MAETIGEVLVAVRPDLSGFEGEIETGLSNITGQIGVTADTTELVAGIAAVTEGAAPAEIAVDANTESAAAEIGALVAAPEQLELFADTAPASDAIDALLASVASDTPSVTVTADTGPAQDEIDALVETNAGESIDVPVSASGSEEASAGLESVKGAAEHLHGASEITAGSAAGLTTILGKMGPEGAAAAAGVAAITAGTTELFHAGLEAIGAEERFNRLLGEQAEAVRHVDVGSLNTDLFDLGEAFGSTDAQVENTTANLFQFAKNAGAGDDEASHFADQIAALSARAISLNPNLGTMSDVADTLAVRLARGGRFASNFGLSLTSAEINLRALQDTGKGTAAELTLYEKSAAAAEIATERYGASLDTIVAAGSKNAQVEVEALSAEFHNAVEEIGKPLVAPVIDVLHDAIEPGKEVAAIFAELGEIGLPLLDAGLHLAAGPLKIVGAALEIIAPPLQLVADLIDAIPEPVLGAVGAMAGLVFIVAELPGPLALAAAGLGAVTDAAVTSVAALAVVEPEVLLIGAAVGALTFAWLNSQQGSEQFKKSVEDITQALNDDFGVLDTSTQKLTDFLAVADTIGKDPDHVKALNELGVHISDIADFSDHGRAGLDKLITSTLGLGKATDVTNQEQEDLENVIDVNGRQYQVMDDNIRHTIVAYKEQVAAAEKAAEVEARHAVNLQQVTDEQLNAAISAHTAKGEQTDWVAVINDLKPSLDAAGQAAASQADETKKAADAAAEAAAKEAEQKKALDDLVAAMPGVGLAFAGIAINAGDRLVPSLDDVVTRTDAVQTSFEALAIQITDTKLTQDQMAALATGLGVTADQLQQFADDVTTAIDNMTKEASEKLPTAQGAIDAIVQFLGKIPDSLNPQNVIDAISKNVEAIAQYQENIDFLFSSHLPHLTELALKEGPQVTAALVEGIKRGGPDIGESLDASLAFADASTSNFQAHIQNDVAPQLALALGLVGKAMTDAFGQTFEIRQPTDAELQQAQLTAELANVPFAQALETVAGKGVVAYQQAIGALPGVTQGTVDGIPTTIDGAQGKVEQAGQDLGAKAQGGFGDKLGGVTTDVLGVGDIIGGAVGNQELINKIVGSGNVLGVALDSGIIQGINFGAGSPDGRNGGVSGAMVSMIEAAIDAARNAAGVHSPSTVFAEIGGQMADGLAIGLDGGTSDVTAAANRLATAAALITPSVSPEFGRSPLTSGAPAGESAPAGGGTTTKAGDTFVIHTTDPFVAAAEVIRKKRSDGRDGEL